MKNKKKEIIKKIEWIYDKLNDMEVKASILAGDIEKELSILKETDAETFDIFDDDINKIRVKLNGITKLIEEINKNLEKISDKIDYIDTELEEIKDIEDKFDDAN